MSYKPRLSTTRQFTLYKAACLTLNINLAIANKPLDNNTPFPAEKKDELEMTINKSFNVCETGTICFTTYDLLLVFNSNCVCKRLLIPETWCRATVGLQLQMKIVVIWRRSLTFMLSFGNRYVVRHHVTVTVTVTTTFLMHRLQVDRRRITQSIKCVLVGAQ